MIAGIQGNEGKARDGWTVMGFLPVFNQWTLSFMFD